MTKEEAIKIVRENMHLSYDKGNVFEALKTLVPELAEWSENERIRKWLYDYIHNCPNESFEFYGGVGKQAVLAYLEKLGEQKYLYYDQGFVEGMRQSKSLANAEIIVSPPKMTNKISVSEELYEHIRETCACIDDAMSSKSLVDITDYLEMADKSAQAAFDMLEKQQTAEWSEEDETRLTNILIMLKEYLIHHYSKDDIDKSVDWLENRVKFLRPQPKQEWSEEDKGLLVKCISALQNSGNWFLADKLSSLCPQPSWKPTEEQLEAAQYVSQFDYGGHKAALESLYEQLKKLQS